MKILYIIILLLISACGTDPCKDILTNKKLTERKDFSSDEQYNKCVPPPYNKCEDIIKNKLSKLETNQEWDDSFEECAEDVSEYKSWNNDLWVTVNINHFNINAPSHWDYYWAITVVYNNGSDVGYIYSIYNDK